MNPLNKIDLKTLMLNNPDRTLGDVLRLYTLECTKAVSKITDDNTTKIEGCFR